MKTCIAALACLFLLAGCDDKPQVAPVTGLSDGHVHFASILVLDDLISNGIESDFVALSPVAIVNPDETVSAESILEAFRKDFQAAHEAFPLKVAEGMSLTWNLDHQADGQYGMAYHKEDRSKNVVFAGKLSVRFDPEFYSTTPYPAFPKDSSVTVICHEYSTATERKNDYLVWIEVSLDKCLAATDYYASIRNQLKNQQAELKARLLHVYHGREAVPEEVAQQLVTFYKTAGAFAEDSACLTGSRDACLGNLKAELIARHEDAAIAEIATIKVLPEGKEMKRETGAVLPAAQSTQAPDTADTASPADNAALAEAEPVAEEADETGENGDVHEKAVAGPPAAAVALPASSGSQAAAVAGAR